MGAFDYFKNNMTQKYADFNGRARRSEYWYFVLFNMIFAIVAMVLDNVLGLSWEGIGYGWLYLLYALATLLPGLSAAVRRLHDVGKSGWFILIPIYNLILALTAGEVGPNEYGPDPKGNGEIDLVDHIN